MDKQSEFIHYIQTAVIVRYSKWNCTPGQGMAWAMEKLRHAYEVAPKIPEVLSAYQAALQFIQVMFDDQRPSDWKAPEWLLDKEICVDA